MSINQRQFNQLTEMGISLWQCKVPAFEQSSSTPSNTDQQKNDLTFTKDDLTSISSTVIFSDILLCLGLSIGEVRVKNNYLDLGLFNWYFNLASPEPSSIQYNNSTLVSPSITQISQSPTLKKQLWQIITNNIL